MNNLTDLANRCLQVSSQFAAKYGNEVGTEHILYGLTSVDSKAKKLLSYYRVTSDIIKDILDNVNGGIPPH